MSGAPCDGAWQECGRSNCITHQRCVEAAPTVPPELAQAMEELKPRLLLVLLARLKGSAIVPACELDEADGYRMTMRFNPSAGNFTFKLERKE